MAGVRVDVKADLLQWACERSGDGEAALRKKFANLDLWISGDVRPTLRQLEDFAKAARVSIGYLFLPEPPVEKLPLQDLRTVGDKGVRKPSPDLLDMVHLCQQRQEWYRDYAQRNDLEPVEFIGSATLESDTKDVAAEMCQIFDFSVSARKDCSNPNELMRLFVERIEESGVLVMISGVVKNSTNRPLKTEEFRGFALADRNAPVIFINGADYKPAQMFTLAHECGHLWLGKSAVSDVGLNDSSTKGTESWCNSVAAELLVPLDDLKSIVSGNPIEQIERYRHTFKVSKPVILRRLLDAKLISLADFDREYALAFKLASTSTSRSSGGDFYNTLPIRVSRRFVKALVADVQTGETSYTESFKLLGISSAKTFRGISQKVETQ